MNERGLFSHALCDLLLRVALVHLFDLGENVDGVFDRRFINLRVMSRAQQDQVLEVVFLSGSQCGIVPRPAFAPCSDMADFSDGMILNDKQCPAPRNGALVARFGK